VGTNTVLEYAVNKIKVEIIRPGVMGEGDKELVGTHEFDEGMAHLLIRQGKARRVWEGEAAIRFDAPLSSSQNATIDTLNNELSKIKATNDTLETALAEAKKVIREMQARIDALEAAPQPAPSAAESEQASEPEQKKTSRKAAK
jgi:uncharacterized protein YukE